MTSRRRPHLRTAVIGLTLAATVAGAAPALADTPDDTREPVVPAGAQLAQVGSLTASPARTTGFSSAVMARTLTSTATRSAYLGKNLSGVVVDPATGAVRWAYRGGDRRIPASTQKLLTAYTVLHSMAPNTTFTTRVMQRATSGSVFLKGQGDPSLTRARLNQLAWSTAASLRTAGRTSVNVYADAGYFPLHPTKATGWRSTTVGSDVQLVRGLALAGYRGRGDSSLAAAKVFAAALTGAGIRATVKGRTSTPAGSWAIATNTSAPVSSLVATMLNVSANDYAEFLLRQAARAKGHSTGWYGARLTMRQTLAAGGIPTSRLTINDGSGLSRANRMPMETMTAVISKLWNNPADNAVVFGPGGMPRSGQSGTLLKRFNQAGTSCARGMVAAKTGTLTGVVALAGVATGVDGRPRVFVLMENGQPRNTPVRRAMDTLATTIVGCH